MSIPPAMVLWPLSDHFRWMIHGCFTWAQKLRKNICVRPFLTANYVNGLAQSARSTNHRCLSANRYLVHNTLHAHLSYISLHKTCINTCMCTFQRCSIPDGFFLITVLAFWLEPFIAPKELYFFVYYAPSYL